MIRLIFFKFISHSVTKHDNGITKIKKIISVFAIHATRSYAWDISECLFSIKNKILAHLFLVLRSLKLTKTISKSMILKMKFNINDVDSFHLKFFHMQKRKALFAYDILI